MTQPPGARVHGVLRRYLPSTLLHDVIEPSLADLQFEVGRAPTSGDRRRALATGYLSLARVLIVVGLQPGGPLRAIVALAVLCTAGTTLTSIARAAQVDGRVLTSAILAPALLAPVVLRALGLTRPGQLFFGSLFSAVTAFALAGGIHAEPAGGVWADVVRTLARLALFVPVAGLASVAAVPASARASGSRRSLAAVALGSGVATVALGLVRWPEHVSLPLGLAMAPFYLVLFTVLFGVTLLPLLLLVRRFVARTGLVAAAVAGSPLPFIAGGYIDHQTLADCLAALRHSPWAVATSSLPFVLGAFAVGWASRPRGQPL